MLSRNYIFFKRKHLYKALGIYALIYDTTTITKMDNEAIYIAQYNEFKKINNGGKISRQKFMKHYEIDARRFRRVFGNSPFLKLKELCGDMPNRFLFKDVPVSHIFTQYAYLLRKKQALPTKYDWVSAKLKPAVTSLKAYYKLSWQDIPGAIINNYSEDPQWQDAIEIIKACTALPVFDNPGKLFNYIADRIKNWDPSRKKMSDGYKKDLKNFLADYYVTEVSIGEDIPGWRVYNKYPVILCEDPTQKEYDALLGQTLRCNKYFGSTIIIILNGSNKILFNNFEKLFTETIGKLGITSVLIYK